MDEKCLTDVTMDAQLMKYLCDSVLPLAPLPKLRVQNAGKFVQVYNGKVFIKHKGSEVQVPPPKERIDIIRELLPQLAWPSPPRAI